MNKLRNIFLFCAVVGLITACSSEEEMMKKSEENFEWQELGLSLGVEEGAKVESRAMGDLDDNDLPKAKYPQDLGIFLHTYSDNKYGKVITLNKLNENRDAKFFYRISDDKNTIIIKNNDGESISVGIEEYSPEFKSPKDLFFFASQEAVSNVPFPELNDDWVKQVKEWKDGATQEFGDKLFATEGYYFQKKETGKIGLFYIIRSVDSPTEIKEIVEVKDWEEEQLELSMKRLTACVSVRLVIVDSFKGGAYVNISGIDELTEFEAAADATNAALHQKYSEHSDFDIKNLLVWKKAFRNYPSIFDWEEGLYTGKPRKALCLCNLDFPSKIDAVVDYSHGSNLLHSVTATCDNEPFIPVGVNNGGGLPNISIDMFLSVGSNDGYDEKDGTLQLNVPFSNDLAITPNTHTYMYVVITLENLAEFLDKWKESHSSNTRAAIQEKIVLNPEQLIITSEPYRSDKK